MIVDGERLKKWIEENKVHMKFQAGSVSFPGGYIEGIRVDDVSDFWEALKKCEVDIQPQARIEAAIKKLEKYVDEHKGGVKPHTVLDGLNILEVAGALAFGRWVLERKQNFFTDKDLGL